MASTPAPSEHPAAGLLGLREAADRLGVHYMTAYRYVRTGRLPATRIGAQWWVDPDAVRRCGLGGR
jgi:excisionase family DNA binding protein